MHPNCCWGIHLLNSHMFDLDPPWGTPNVAVINVEVYTYSTVTFPAGTTAAELAHRVPSPELGEGFAGSGPNASKLGSAGKSAGSGRNPSPRVCGRGGVAAKAGARPIGWAATPWVLIWADEEGGRAKERLEQKRLHGNTN